MVLWLNPAFNYIAVVLLIIPYINILYHTNSEVKGGYQEVYLKNSYVIAKGLLELLPHLLLHSFSHTFWLYPLLHSLIFYLVKNLSDSHLKRKYRVKKSVSFMLDNSAALMYLFKERCTHFHIYTHTSFLCVHTFRFVVQDYYVRSEKDIFFNSKQGFLTSLWRQEIAIPLCDSEVDYFLCTPVPRIPVADLWNWKPSEQLFRETKYLL